MAIGEGDGTRKEIGVPEEGGVEITEKDRVNSKAKQIRIGLRDLEEKSCPAHLRSWTTLSWRDRVDPHEETSSTASINTSQVLLYILKKSMDPHQKVALNVSRTIANVKITILICVNNDHRQIHVHDICGQDILDVFAQM
jgi:hypothetical protein